MGFQAREGAHTIPYLTALGLAKPWGVRPCKLQLLLLRLSSPWLVILWAIRPGNLQNPFPYLHYAVLDKTWVVSLWMLCPCLPLLAFVGPDRTWGNKWGKLHHPLLQMISARPDRCWGDNSVSCAYSFMVCFFSARQILGSQAGEIAATLSRLSFMGLSRPWEAWPAKLCSLYQSCLPQYLAVSGEPCPKSCVYHFCDWPPQVQTGMGSLAGVSAPLLQ